MTGLEKMKSQILDEAKAVADSKIAEAKAQSEAEIANYKERVASSIDLQRRTKVLAAKQDVIKEVLNEAYESLTGMEADAYFAMLLKMLGKYALPQDGEIFFSARDLKRMPAGFQDEVKKAAESKNGSLTVSEEGRNIENGFILAYGGIEENCTLQAMFDAKRDELSDKVHHLLFL